MNYSLLYPLGNHSNIWLFGYDDPETGHHPFPEYRDLICPNCGKLDEPAAIRRGIHASVKVSSPKDARRDLIGSEDGQLLISRRLLDALERHGISGIEALAMPGEERFFLAMPQRVPTDFSSAGLEVHGPYREGPYRGMPYRTVGDRLETADHRCIVCGRYYELCLQPTLRSMHLPDEPLALFSSSIRFEKQHGEVILLFCSDDVRKALKAAGLRGLDFADA